MTVTVFRILCMITHSFFVSEDVVLPEKSKLKFMNKVPNLKKAKKERKRLWDIQGPARAANTFTTGQYAIVVSPAVAVLTNQNCH